MVPALMAVLLTIGASAATGKHDGITAAVSGVYRLPARPNPADQPPPPGMAYAAIAIVLRDSTARRWCPSPFAAYLPFAFRPTGLVVGIWSPSQSEVALRLCVGPRSGTAGLLTVEVPFGRPFRVGFTPARGSPTQWSVPLRVP